MVNAFAMRIFGDRHVGLASRATLVPAAKHALQMMAPFAVILEFVREMDHRRGQATACAFRDLPEMHAKSAFQDTMVQPVRLALDSMQVEIHALVMGFAMVRVCGWQEEGAVNVTKGGKVKTAVKKCHALNWTIAVGTVTV